MSAARACRAEPASAPDVGRLVRRKCRSCGKTSAQGPCAGCAARAQARSGEQAPQIVLETLASPGRPLEPALRRHYEPRWGVDFSNVRVHDDAQAAASAAAIDASAYAVGSRIVLGQGQRVTDARLLAHELAHVVQQRDAPAGGATSGPLVIGEADSHAEHEADAQSAAIAGGSFVAAPPLSREPHPLVRRLPLQAEPGGGTAAERPKCGPDATAWFIGQVNAAMVNPTVQAIKVSLSAADTAAKKFGTTSDELAEAGGTAAIMRQESKLGSAAPARNPTIRGQLGKGSVSLIKAATATASTVFGPKKLEDSASAAFFLGTAALLWRSLVNHGAPFDFKAHVLNHPKSANCPAGCPPGEIGTVTLCPTPSADNCYESDVPGNLFYSLIGKFVGFSKLTLQLGSQYAELTDTKVRPARPKVGWDSPEDTQAIDLAHGWKLPLTSAVLCGALHGARGRLGSQTACADCPEAL